jgi:hypothetical protein
METLMRHLPLCLLVIAASPFTAPAQVVTRAADPQTVVREYIAAQNRHDVDRMLSLVADPLEIRTGLSNASLANALSEDQSHLRERFARIVASFPGAHTDVLEVMTEGGVVVTRERTTGLPGNRSDTGLAMYRVQNGRIVSFWIVSSTTTAGDRQ